MSTLQEILMKKYDLEEGDILLDEIYVPVKVAVNHLNTLVSEVNNLQKENEELKGALESINENLMLMLASYGDNTRTEKLIKDSLKIIKGGECE